MFYIDEVYKIRCRTKPKRCFKRLRRISALSDLVSSHLLRKLISADMSKLSTPHPIQAVATLAIAATLAGCGADLLSSVLAAIALNIFNLWPVPIAQALGRRQLIPALTGWTALIALLVSRTTPAMDFLPTWLGFFAIAWLVWTGQSLTAAAQTTELESDRANTGSTLPRWLTEFIDAHGAPSHLRTSRNYIEVCGDVHSSYVRISMASAAEQIPSELGLRIHKEYYVMRAAISGHERDGNRHILVLSDTVKLPVGRAFLSDVRAQGLLD